MKEQIFFMHVPKCGGTSFRMYLYDVFDKHSTFPTASALKANNGKYLPQMQFLKRKELHATELICGHYHYQVINHLQPNCKVITILRNPIDRVLSHARHLRDNHIDHKGKDIEQIILEELNSITSVISKFFGFQSGTKNFNEAKQHLRNTHFIGIMEHFEDTITLFANEYGTPKKPIKHYNSSRIKPEIGSKTMARICSKISKDMKLYEIAYNRFQAAIVKI